MKPYIGKLICFFLSFTALNVYAINPKIPHLGRSGDTGQLIDKAKPKVKQPQSVKKHGGYKVIDSQGNESYIDNIKNPKKQVILTQVNDNRKLGGNRKIKIESNVHIGKLCFDLVCR